MKKKIKQKKEERKTHSLLSLHELEALKVGELQTQLLGSQTLRPGALGPLLVDLGLGPGLLEAGDAHAVLDLEHKLGQVKGLDVEHTAGHTGAIDQHLNDSRRHETEAHNKGSILKKI